MANNKIGSNSSRKSEGKSAGNGSEVAEPKKTLASSKFIRLGTIVWAKLDGWALALLFLMPAEKLSGFQDDRLAILLNQACNSLYERGVLEALRAVAFIRDHKKLVKGTADKLKTWAIKLLASSKSNNILDVVLDEFPKWLQRSIDRIKDTNTKLKRIASEIFVSLLDFFRWNRSAHLT
ncbi:hypothetical protein DAPPUDRAFT_335023 [Daphnia pulex]|uniref:Uncharacterized protein n=1 Tax=Daphnia pulex TaxID=6669 RepID=E9HWX6_DAPPU|nr:hypothetical protein DAPPUDRAFT_335023 [Daphnia pulex]|eukprot:EFX63757.1 hypothetical protein DAPPUDRAFT_335023 [Daphnia pulex]